MPASTRSVGQNPQFDDAVAAIGDGTISVAAGVARIEKIDHLFQSLADGFDKIDVLFINAGVGELTHLGDMTEKVYDEVFAINTKGAYFTMQKSLPFLNNGAFSHSRQHLSSSLAGAFG